VRDDDGLPAALPNGIQTRAPIPVSIQDQAILEAGGVLQLLFDADQWDSLISFEAGINVELNGALEVSFAEGVDVATQVGRTMRIFDWSGVSPVGQFDIRSPYVWDTDKLYSTGEVTLMAISALPGDFNQDGSVDAADYVVWRKGLGTTYTDEDYNIWRAHLGEYRSGSAVADPLLSSVPEPAVASIVLASVMTIAPAYRAVRRRRQD
jgi:hypothetical protein